jgi:hypothetical protein
MKTFLPIITALTLSSALAVDNKMAGFIKAIQNDLMPEARKAGHIRGPQGERNLEDERVCLPNFSFVSHNKPSIHALFYSINQLFSSHRTLPFVSNPDRPAIADAPSMASFSSL